MEPSTYSKSIMFIHDGMCVSIGLYDLNKFQYKVMNQDGRIYAGVISGFFETTEEIKKIISMDKLEQREDR
jgi:hypothetical protein